MVLYKQSNIAELVGESESGFIVQFLGLRDYSPISFGHMNTGIVKTKMDKGFGFISYEGAEKDLFFHANELAGGLAFDDLQEGAQVTFDIAQGPKGPNAVNVALA